MDMTWTTFLCLVVLALTWYFIINQILVERAERNQHKQGETK